MYRRSCRTLMVIGTTRSCNGLTPCATPDRSGPVNAPNADEPQVTTAEREVAAPAEQIFELIADPARQIAWDGNDNLAEADSGQRVRGVGVVFVVRLTGGQVRENHVVEFTEGRRIAWRPA